MITAAEATRDRWLALPAGSEIDLGAEMMRTTYRIILDTMLSGPTGIDAGEVARGVRAYLRASSWMFAVALLKAPAWLPYPGKRPALASVRAMRGEVGAMVAARREARTGADDLIEMLLDAVEPDSGRTMTDAEITDNILTFVLAGHETTAVALGWTFALLADQPEVVARLVAEIDAVTRGEPVRPDHIAGLGYARQVVSETMRLYPPAPLIARAVARDIELGGVPLPAGSVIFVPIYAVQRHAATWARPEVFDPDRFAPEAVRARHRFAYMPFGAGPRVCIGNGFAIMEAVAILAVLLQALRLERIGPMPGARMRLTLRPTEAIRMRATART